MLIVKKFGGTSVGSTERVARAAGRIAEDYKAGNDIIVVLSAMGKTTDDLITLAHAVNPEPSKREMDMLVSTGEQVSAALMAMALGAIGIPAISLNAFQVAMHTSSTYGSARFKKIDRDRIRHELDARKVVLITGFQGVNKYHDVTTLGRGGSDTTAVALAASLHADACEIYTDVDGIYTADPRYVKHAKKLDEITYDEMLDLTTLGAGVLHNRSVELAKKYGIPLLLCSSFEDVPGTIVREDTKVEKMLVSGVAVDKSADRISVVGLKDVPGMAFRLFDLLASEKINVDVILQSIGRDGTKDISFTVADEDADEVMRILGDNRSLLEYKDLSLDRDIAKVSIVGAGMVSNPGVAAKMFEVLYNEGINISMISTSEIRVTVLVNEKYAERAANAIHDAFLGED